MNVDINKLRSRGLRYIVCDQNGQMWASERVPVRSKDYSGKWVMPRELTPPEMPSELHYYIDGVTHAVACSDPVLEAGYHNRRDQHYAYRIMTGRQSFVPISPIPAIPTITWEDDPYDLVQNGVIPESDMKTWPDPPRF